ncbi:MAG: apolipoprotein N-acyltransferase [Treponema sp.]|jgi:apolipoprotein N-acyltransferase|nr:apolipoprotein N-acyltransferase [Treponema sp.]
MTESHHYIKSILIQLGLVITASLFFSLSFPNLLFQNGIPFLAWFSYIPILLLISKNDLLPCIGWGAIYGVFTYAIFNYWLWTFHPAAGIIVYCIYLGYMAVVFLFLKLACFLYPKKAYLVQWVIWLAYEYLKTKGFVGYPYGITGYTQWRVIPLIQIASVFGVWGVSAIVSFPSFWLAAALKEHNGSIFAGNVISTLTGFFRREKLSAVIWAIALIAALTFGITQNKDFSDAPQAKIALVQHNTDPWKAVNFIALWQKLETYRQNLSILKRLSDEAVASQPKPDLIVWPETAFIQSIYWHSTYRIDQDSWLIVKELLEYLSTKDIPFLIGNDDARMDKTKNPDELENHRVDYNATLLFENGKITKTYRKLHLVPFTEHFPYRKQLPFFYDALVKADTHFWEKGEEETVFSAAGFNFSSPICFEDTFGYLSRNFVLKGADVLVNLTNDAWAKSLPSQKQHLTMAVFRAIENHRSMVRSTVSGQTCAIDPAGRVITEAQPFKETWLAVSVPLVKKITIYTKYGDFPAIIFLFTAVILLLSPIAYYTIRKLKRGYGK